MAVANRYVPREFPDNSIQMWRAWVCRFLEPDCDLDFVH